MAAMLRPGSRNVARAMSPGQSPNLCCGARCVGGCVIDPPTQHVTGGTPDCRASIRPWFSSTRVGTDCTANRFASAGAASTSTSTSLSAPARSAASWIRAGPRCGRGRTSWSTRNVGKPEAATPPNTRAVDHIDVDHLRSHARRGRPSAAPPRCVWALRRGARVGSAAAEMPQHCAFVCVRHSHAITNLGLVFGPRGRTRSPGAVVTLGGETAHKLPHRQ